jgi:hypothetical protein
MHPEIRSKGLLFAVALVLAPVVARGQSAPKVRATSGFRLLARAFGAITINRVYCGLDAMGEICVDSTNSNTIGGGYWPKNSPQQYLYSSGMQVAGMIDTAGGWSWAGDTTGAFFFDSKGTTQHGQQVEPIWNYADAGDRAHWPAAANVPLGDASASLYGAALQGRPSASEGDIWTLAWEGDPALIAGRPHPLGIAMETRVLGWNYPSGNNDIIYFVHTFYNISSGCAADYAGIRPGMREELLALGHRFQDLNNTKFGITMPVCGYTLRNLYFNLAADPDVSSDAGNNYSSVNIPLQLGYAYEDGFRRTDGGYALPGGLGDPPFLPGYGFVGFKFLKTPLVDGQEPGIRIYSGTTGGSSFNDAVNVQQLFRYISGNINLVLGDGPCNYVPATDHICFIKKDGHADTRQFQSTGPADLPPGGSVSIVATYIFASAVATAGCPTSPCGVTSSVVPNNALRMTDAAALASTGTDLLDSLTGFRGYVDANADGKVQGNEFQTVRGSLLQKAQLAQVIFDGGFVLPTPPDAPAFFLVPGNDQVAVFWRPSATETSGDPYFSIASDPAGPGYDPNFRQFDVEGYRIYRGRVDDPLSLTLLQQYDYYTTTMRDYLGTVAPSAGCAPELGLNTVAQGCPLDFTIPAPGSAYTAYTALYISSPFVQVRLGDRFLKASGVVFTSSADTAITGGAGGRPELTDNGVSFVYVDKGVKNNLRYFYAVTAFDINSIQSGPSSLESAKITRSVTPVAPGSNFQSSGSLAIGVYGRQGVNMTAAIPAAPTIDPTTGVFSGPARPATGASIGFLTELVPQVVRQASWETSLRLDSMQPGSAYDLIATTLWFTITTPSGNLATPISVLQDQGNSTNLLSDTLEGPPIDSEEVVRYGGSGSYHSTVGYDLAYPGNFYTAAFGRGCANAAPGFTSGRCSYNGARWFSGANETFPHPTRGNQLNNSVPGALSSANLTNAGSLTGVLNVFEARAYQNRPNVYRSVEGVLGAVATGADYRVYWNAAAAGVVDSVVDVTHNLTLPFDATMGRGYTWGFLTTAATSGIGSGDGRTTSLSVTDLGCVAPLHGEAGIGTGASFATPDGHLGCAATTHYHFVNTAALGQIAIGNSVAADGSVASVRPNNGFGMYLAGHFFLFEMGGSLPQGTVWTMRGYVGGIIGGGSSSIGQAGNEGAYSFVSMPSPFTAVGASLKGVYTVTNGVRQATRADLDRVHTVPDPYYVTNPYETDPTHKVVKFVNLPIQAIIRIYSLSGILVRVIEHNSATLGGEEDWDVRNNSGRLVASGVYFYHIESPSGARRAGRMTLVTFGR